ncbi:MAG TPA: GNAT family N-acetyltransferase [Candidatus Methylomirabilis sp.]|nr:GNAT family N-acetyltransferase [Candidatus Methylomirabilis sp.]
MIIEQAKVSDAEEILSLQKLSYKSEAEIYNDFNIPPLTQTLEEMKRDFGDQIFLKAVIEGKIIGSVRAIAKEDSCDIRRLIVHPDFQNRGIGTKLINEIEGVFNTSRRFELFTGHKSEKNIHIYQKLGYKTFKTEKITDNIIFMYMEKTNSSKTLD